MALRSPANALRAVRWLLPVVVCALPSDGLRAEGTVVAGVVETVTAEALILEGPNADTPITLAVRADTVVLRRQRVPAFALRAGQEAVAFGEWTLRDNGDRVLRVGVLRLNETELIEPPALDPTRAGAVLTGTLSDTHPPVIQTADGLLVPLDLEASADITRAAVTSVADLFVGDTLLVRPGTGEDGTPVARHIIIQNRAPTRGVSGVVREVTDDGFTLQPGGRGAELTVQVDDRTRFWRQEDLQPRQLESGLQMVALGHRVRRSSPELHWEALFVQVGDSALHLPAPRGMAATTLRGDIVSTTPLIVEADGTRVRVLLHPRARLYRMTDTPRPGLRPGIALFVHGIVTPEQVIRATGIILQPVLIVEGGG